MKALLTCHAAIIILAALSVPAQGDVDNDEGVHWALVAAGSSGWENYRHQSDACHAYHILRRHGIPAERIVTMMYDDIAQNEWNPTKGVILNHPKGGNVYSGVVIDYKGNDVTPENFLAVLSGNQESVQSSGPAKVIKSGHKDNIFVYYVDHGAPGFIAFPNRKKLSARQLADTIQSMHVDNKYAKMVLYIEACHSGSMFDGILPNDINVFVTTSANPFESSYACYSFPQHIILTTGPCQVLLLLLRPPT